LKRGNEEPNRTSSGSSLVRLLREMGTVAVRDRLNTVRSKNLGEKRIPKEKKKRKIEIMLTYLLLHSLGGKCVVRILSGKRADERAAEWETSHTRRKTTGRPFQKFIPKKLGKKKDK